MNDQLPDLERGPLLKPWSSGFLRLRVEMVIGCLVLFSLTVLGARLKEQPIPFIDIGQFEPRWLLWLLAIWCVYLVFHFFVRWQDEKAEVFGSFEELERIQIKIRDLHGAFAATFRKIEPDQMASPLKDAINAVETATKTRRSEVERNDKYLGDIPPVPEPLLLDYIKKLGDVSARIKEDASIGLKPGADVDDKYRLDVFALGNLAAHLGGTASNVSAFIRDLRQEREQVNNQILKLKEVTNIAVDKIKMLEVFIGSDLPDAMAPLQEKANEAVSDIYKLNQRLRKNRRYGWFDRAIMTV